MKKNELKKYMEILQKNQKFIHEHYHVKSVGIFGSIVRGDSNKKSDIDILIELSEPISFFMFIELEEFLKKKLRRKVDLVTKKALKPIIKKNILKEVVYT
ncbi:MAG: nucleotidyltransferase family protein [Candidatus Omnitrophota bacterium]